LIRLWVLNGRKSPALWKSLIFPLARDDRSVPHNGKPTDTTKGGRGLAYCFSPPMIGYAIITYCLFPQRALATWPRFPAAPPLCPTHSEYLRRSRQVVGVPVPSKTASSRSRRSGSRFSAAKTPRALCSPFPYDSDITYPLLVDLLQPLDPHRPS